MAECKTALRGDEVICLTHNQRYAGCVLDERDRLKAEVERLNEKVKVAELQLREAREVIGKVAPVVGHIQKGKTHAFPGFPAVDLECPQCQLEAVLDPTQDPREDRTKVVERQNDELRSFLCRVSCKCDHQKLMEDRHDEGCEYAGFIAVVDSHKTLCCEVCGKAAPVLLHSPSHCQRAECLGKCRHCR